MTFFYPPFEPYPCGCEPFKLCLKHQLMADAQRAALAVQRKMNEKRT